MDTLKRIQIILDERTATILKLTAEEPKTASEISQELDIPHSVCYRKIKQLTDAGLLGESSPEDPWKRPEKGKPKGYISNIDKVYVALERGEMMIVLKRKSADKSEVYHLSTANHDISLE